MNFSDHDLEIASKTLWAEARGEPLLGQQAVAWVLLRRATQLEWPNSLAEVCQQPWQFSCWNENDPNRPLLDKIGPAEYVRQEIVLKSVLDGKVPDPVAGAQFYFGDYIAPPPWAKTMIFTAHIGRHVFFRQGDFTASPFDVIT
jgi:spore germination cell wall hydrolase CwlJ-like protein